ncbi:MAG: hypothetical protein IJM30_02140 [Thermoguttaceae bacterium]|nr:hypothetical protein [Thermoguttaceae bacterium]
MGLSERKKEINCRRKRRAQLARLKRMLPTFDAEKKAAWVEKLRRMTPGAEQIIADLQLEAN